MFAPPISIGKVDKIVIRTVFKYQDSANLVSNGMLYFSRANWTNLTKLFLCTPQHINRIWSRHVAIKNISCKILSQTPLPNLQMIKLSSPSSIQVLQISTVLLRSTLRRQSGPTSNLSKSVMLPLFRQN